MLRQRLSSIRECRVVAALGAAAAGALGIASTASQTSIHPWWVTWWVKCWERLSTRGAPYLKKLALAAGAAVGQFCAVAALAATGWKPVIGDFQTILNHKSSEVTVWRLAENTEITIFDFPTMAQQGRMFNRITQLTEQFAEPYKRVLTGAEFEKYLASIRRTDLNFAYGHDVLLSELALFYNLADRDKIELNAEEAALREFLVEQGALRVWRGITQAVKPNAVVLAVPQVREADSGGPKITELARRAILMHELAHGEYYSNAYYADFCRKFWREIMSEKQREAFTRFLSKYNYSINYDELLVNEMQAYLMFTPDSNSFSAEKLGVSENELAEMRRAFRRARPPTRLPFVY